MTDHQNDVTATIVNSWTAADDAHVARLARQLPERAEQEGLLDVGYRTLDSPIGTLLLAATTTGVVRIAFDCEDHEAVLTDLCEQISPRILPAPARLDRAAIELEEYFAGRRDHFDVPLDLRATPFRARVLTALSTIAYGDTRSYADLAAAVGNARAVRAVGSACATNPLPLLLPCHRVIRSDGGLGGYRGGLGAKEHLLALENRRRQGVHG